MAAFCAYAMQTAIDQARSMASMFSLKNFQVRAAGYFRAVRYTDMKPETAHLYLHAFGLGEFERGEAGRIAGLSERAARAAPSGLVGEGFLVSDSPKGKVRAGFPVHALGPLLPNLYPAGNVDITAEALAEMRRRRKIAASRLMAIRRQGDGEIGGALLRAYKEFEERVGTIERGRGAKGERVRAEILRRTLPFSISEIDEACPGGSRDMVRLEKLLRFDPGVSLRL